MADEVEKALATLRSTVGVEKAYSGMSALTSAEVNKAFLAGSLSYLLPGQRKLPLKDVLQISAVLVCLDILSQDIAKTTLRLYRRGKGGGKTEVLPTEHPMAEMLALEPNKFHHWYEIVEMMMLHLGLWQNAFWAKKITTMGRPTEFIPLLPGTVEIVPQPDRGGYAYKISRHTDHEKVMLNGLPDVLLEEEIIHFRGRMFDGLTGYSNLEAGAKTFMLANEITEFHTRLYEADGATRGVFTMKEHLSLSDEALAKFRGELSDAFSDFLRLGKPLLLEDGLEFKPVGMTADQAESTNTFSDAVLSVARQFRIPPHKLFHLVNVKYENMETLEGSYVFDTLIPYCSRIEERLKRDTLDRKERLEFFYEFDREEMVLHDPEVQAEVLAVLLPNGVITIDEARKRRGLNPLPNGSGDVRLIPSTYTVVDDNNNVVIAAGGLDPEAAKEDAASADPAPDDDPDKTEADKALLRLIQG